jgi:hypothetical protein
MNRHALRSALGRAQTARALSRDLPISSTTPATFFSTSSSGPSDNSKGSKGSSSSGSSSNNRSQNQSAAVEKLGQLNKRRGGFADAGGPRREALDSMPGIRSFADRNPGGFNTGGGGGGGGGGAIDARSLRVSPDSPGSAAAGPRVLNLRSLRGGRTPFGRGGGGAGGGEGAVGGFGRPRLGFGGPGAAAGGAGGPSRGGFGGGGFGGRFGGGGFGGVGARPGMAGRGRGRGRGGARGRGRGGRGGRKDDRKDKKDTQADKGKMRFNSEEQAVIDRLEKGEVVPFDPKVTFDTLSGYGAALATDAPIGQVETALRTMRLMTGGMAFNAESGVTADITAIMKRYQAKKPIFVHSKEEKAWIESAQPRLHLVGPDASTKKAIVDSTIRGKYEATGFTETSDVKATMANYHSRTFTYMGSDSQKFMDKVLSLLPAQQGGAPAAQARR